MPSSLTTERFWTEDGKPLWPDPVVHPLVTAARPLASIARAMGTESNSHALVPVRQLQRLLDALAPFQEPDTEGGDAHAASAERSAPESALQVAGGEPVDSGLAPEVFRLLKEKETDCGVCGVPDTVMVEVCTGYAVPRCPAHRGAPAYQAESRLHELLSTQQKGKG